MGVNLMSNRNRNEVIEVARETVGAQLAADEAAPLLAELPPGDPLVVRRPPDLPVAEWPGLEELGARIGRIAAEPI
jgi:hypothetical protein